MTESKDFMDSTPPDDTSDDQPIAPERVSRLSAPGSGGEGDEVVREYQRRYRPSDVGPADQPEAVGEPRRGLNITLDVERIRSEGSRMWNEVKRKEMPRSYSTLVVSDDEKLWAAVAHASVWVTLVGGIITGGTLVPLSIFIPLIIYFMFRKRSDFVAFHALQSFALQALGTVGAVVLFVLGGLVWGVGMVIALLAMLVLIGFILVPLWGLVGLALLLAVFLLPVAMTLFGTIAAVETYNGRDYRYPRIALWIDRQMAGGVFQA